ncbi:MAG: hypothetical protein M1828_006280 [Chrysothrix sp. TS-e1954]|nr:MAG: hypothetical protein M1828_006280 [Chrysothrix sp. TS-e1954]
MTGAMSGPNTSQISPPPIALVDAPNVSNSTTHLQNSRGDQTTPSRSTEVRHPGFRRSSGFRTSSPHSSPVVNGHESPSSENSPWSSAVGRATLGKSGRVIERLMADIDRLKRELNAEIQHRQEIEKQEEASKTVIRSVSAENSNLLQAKEVDAAMLKRRDRLVEELRDDLSAEKMRRSQAEEAGKVASQKAEDIRVESARELGWAREMAKHATTHADVLQQSHKQLSTEYRQRVGTLSLDLQTLTAERNKEAEKLRRLDVVVEQMEQELSRKNKINVETDKIWQAYREESEQRIQKLEADDVKRREGEAQLRVETERVIGEARWLLQAGRLAVDREKG